MNIKKLAIIGPDKGPGQLGMLLAHEANKLHCAGQLNLKIMTIGEAGLLDWSDEHFELNEENLKFLAAQAELVTYETESISERMKGAFADKLVPSQETLAIFSNREREKKFFQKLRLPIAKYFYIYDEASLEAAKAQMASEENFRGRLKTCEQGYDGHGQVELKKPHELEVAWKQLGGTTCVLEEQLEIYRELSIISTRYSSGEIVHFPVPENEHIKGVLYRSRLAKLNKKTEDKLKKTAEKILNKLSYVGTFVLEVFQLKDANGPLLLNEGAPRVHNSGHFTLQFCEDTNQFDAHIRAICGLEPVYAQKSAQYFSMTNLLGTTKENFQQICNGFAEFVGGSLVLQPYWYGKAEARPARKMGHITAIANSLDELKAFEAYLDTALKTAK